MGHNYWDKVLTRRISRRRALAATGTTAAAAAFLAACGGDDDGPSGPVDRTARDTSGLLSRIEDELDKAVVGGKFIWPNNREPVHFDGKAQGQVQLNHHNSLAYEALVRNKPGVGEPSTNSEVLPHLATSWEVAPDGLTVTFKMRDGVKFHNKPPVNGRLLDAQDVVTTWNKYENATTPNNAPANSNKRNPAAPILSFEAPDARTVVIKLKEPASYLLQRLTSLVTGEIGSIYPKEAGEGFSAEREQIGTGPYFLAEFTPSVRIVHRRNPDYWDSKFGFLEEVEFILLPENAAQQAQFRTGTLSSMVVPADDIIPMKRDVPALAMYSVTLSNTSPGAMQRYGWLPIDGRPSPFLDKRVRQALSMSMDRETHIDAFSNVSRFEREGLPVSVYWHSAQGYVPEFWLNPTDKAAYGENAKYYEYNVEEAKKLIDAAKSAYGGSFPRIPSHRVNAVFGPVYTQEADVMDQYARDIGLDIESKAIDYNLDYLPNFVTKQGQFSGMLYGIGAVTSQHPIDYYVWRFYSKSGPTSGSLGFGGPDGSRGDMSGDPEVDSLIEKGKAELDSNRLKAIVHDLQRYLAGQAYTVARPGFSDSFQLSWPAIRNFATFQGDSRNVLAGTHGIGNYWFDTSKPHS
jgi:ABC-type transport system substrate-binding protein